MVPDEKTGQSIRHSSRNMQSEFNSAIYAATLIFFRTSPVPSSPPVQLYGVVRLPHSAAELGGKYGVCVELGRVQAQKN